MNHRPPTLARIILSVALLACGIVVTPVAGAAAEAKGGAGLVADGVERLEAPFVRGQLGYPDYRIPALVVTRKGTLLAFAEGRANLHDHAENDIVLRRSTDGGRTWGPLQIVAEDGRNCLNNPTVVVLKDGRILVMYQRYPRGIQELQVKEGVAGDQTCLNFIASSDDDGVTWSEPVDITPQVKRPTVATSIASGPGVGIQLRAGRHAGRIIFPFNQGPLRDCQVYAAFSDDNGKTWKYGDLAPAGEAGRGNEVQMVELSGGRVMLNSRGSSGAKLRKVAVSGDGGQTWSPMTNDATLVESQCQASIIRYDRPIPGVNANKAALLFVNPATPRGRDKGTARLSTDDGATWSHAREVVPRDFAYSCLAVAPDGSILCLYETDGYSRIALVRFTIDWLMAPAPAAAAAPAPRAARSVHLGYPVPAPGGDAFYNEMTVEESVPGSYFMAAGFRHGYFGIQELSRGRKVVIFSVWDPTRGDDAKAVPIEQRVEVLHQGEGVEVKRFGGEGTGGQSFFPYDWKVGETCRFLVRATVEDKKTAYAGYFWLPEQKQWKHLVTFRTRTGGDRLTGLYSFVEDFRRDGRSATEARRATFGNAWARVDGKWLPLTRARFTASGADWEAKETIDAGLVGKTGRFYLQTGGATKTTTTLNSTLQRPDGDGKPPELPAE